jgi:hypothetical protein
VTHASHSLKNSRPSKHSSTSSAPSVEDPEFFTALVKGETSLCELIAALDASTLLPPSGPAIRVGETCSGDFAEANAFILPLGERRAGDWQVLEYDEALDMRITSLDFPLIVVLLEGQTARGPPFL